MPRGHGLGKLGAKVPPPAAIRRAGAWPDAETDMPLLIQCAPPPSDGAHLGLTAPDVFAVQESYPKCRLSSTELACGSAARGIPATDLRHRKLVVPTRPAPAQAD